MKRTGQIIRQGNRAYEIWQGNSDLLNIYIYVNNCSRSTTELQDCLRYYLLLRPTLPLLGCIDVA